MAPVGRDNRAWQFRFLGSRPGRPCCVDLDISPDCIAIHAWDPDCSRLARPGTRGNRRRAAAARVWTSRYWTNSEPRWSKTPFGSAARLISIQTQDDAIIQGAAILAMKPTRSDQLKLDRA